MGIYGHVVQYELHPLPLESLATFRKNAEAFMSATDAADNFYAVFIAQCLKESDNFLLLKTVAEEVRWNVEKEYDKIVLRPPHDEVKGGVEYGFVNWLCPFVNGFIQLADELVDDHWRVVWKDGKPCRVVDPIWPDPE